MNSFQKIKAMSINEMAKLLAYSECRICAFNQNKKCSSDKGVGQCHKGIKIWLESEEE